MSSLPLAQEVPSPAAGLVLQRFVDWLQDRLFPSATNPTAVHWVACGIIILGAILLRRLITDLIFVPFRKMTAHSKSTLGTRLFPAIEGPVETLVMVAGITAALEVLLKPASVERLLAYGERAAATSVILWGFLCAGGAILDHFGEIAQARRLEMAALLPLIRRTLAFFFGVFGILLIAESLGVEVKAFLAGLGIGGLAFALAAQDTIANLFGSLVVVMDHPFHIGDTVRIGSNEGTVEDIGLRSTRLRTSQLTQIIIPNKLVATEAVTNLTRMPQRRVDQVIGLDCGTTPDRMEALLADLRAILAADPGVHKRLITVNFSNFGASSLDVQILYFTVDPDWAAHMALRERINLAFMRAVAARGLAFAFPTQTLHFDGPVARQIAGLNPGSAGSA